jgi:hypothetical protein
MVHNEHLISEREQDINQINKQVKEVSGTLFALATKMMRLPLI